MKYLIATVVFCCINFILIAQHTEIEHESVSNDPHLQLTQTHATDQYSRIWFKNALKPAALWSLRGGVNLSDESDFDFRYFDGSTTSSILKLDATAEEAIFSTDILADGKGIFHRTDNLTQFLDVITSGENADAKIRLGSGGGVDATIGWDPGSKSLKLIPDAFSFTNGGLVIADGDEGVRYGFNTAPNDSDRMRIAFDPDGAAEAHLNLIATGSGDFARLKFTESTGFTDHEFILLGGLDENDPRFYISYREAGNVGFRMMSFKPEDKSIEINNTIDLIGENPQKGGLIDVRDSLGNNKVRIYANPTVTDPGGWISMFNEDNDRTILLNADRNGTGLSRVTTDELALTGGSDFAEHFDIEDSARESIKAGYVVSINTDSPGLLELSETAYDTKVAGIISGANGVRPGIMMGQKGSIADGEYPIALSGRVYVYANKENGNINPGDLLTSSSTLGVAMKATNPQRSFGSIIGKAMTSIDENGFVLVLVNLQ